MEKLLWELHDNDHYTVGYTDDTAILINRKFPQTVSEVLQTALCIVHQWCDRTKLSINPNKTVKILLTRKRDIKLFAVSSDRRNNVKLEPDYSIHCWFGYVNFREISSPIL
jgi:hypothetical protein